MFKNRFLNVVIAVVLLAVLMFTIQEAIATRAVLAEVEIASNSSYAVNPELKVIDRFSAERNAAGASVQLAINPELSAARHYSEQRSADNAALLINPELSAANHFAASIDRTSASSFLATNPELSAAWRYAAKRAGN